MSKDEVLLTKEQLAEVGYLDIGLSTSKTFISKAIRFFMKRYAKSIGANPKKYWSHSFMIVNMWDERYVAEAVANGYILRPFKTSYLGRTNFKIGRIRGEKGVVPVPSKKLVEEVSKKAASLSFKQTRYDIMNFFWQIIKSYTGKWFRRDKSITKKLYCTEAVAVLSNIIKPGMFKEPGAVNPLDIDLHGDIEWVIDYSEK